MKETIAQLALHLSLVKGVGPGLCKRLHDELGDNFLLLYNLKIKELMSFGFSEQTSELIVSGLAQRSVLERELELLKKNSISFVTLFDQNYPALLKEIHLPPIVLYYKGPLVQEDALAVVGSRDANNYGQYAIEQFVPPLVAHNFAIVSGGALGADAMAHRATIKAGGRTIVVLGSGLLKWYPATNQRLFQSVLDNGGTLISSFALETTPAPGNFPARNRIIAGLSRGCLVVQAAQESGAKITALFALEQGREVFAVPGPISDSLSAGCHSLIQQGAKLVHTAHDILAEFNLVPAGKIFATGEKEKISRSAEQITINFSLPLAQQIVQACSRPLSLDQLVEQLNSDLSTCQAAIFDLQLAGVLEQTFNGMWQKSV
ncbi:MAG TPA: DNA-processing protein DprA [Candidatus Babeliales bacterium]|nr:DNA-processing protein DprA [Candidatus Babeliales bacterium]